MHQYVASDYCKFCHTANIKTQIKPMADSVANTCHQVLAAKCLRYIEATHFRVSHLNAHVNSLEFSFPAVTSSIVSTFVSDSPRHCSQPQ